MSISIREKLDTLCSHYSDTKKTWKPLFYRIYNTKEREEFHELLKIPGIMITDELLGQVKELVKINHPKQKLTSEEQEEAALKHINSHKIEDYGVWVYYPWSNKLVHIVDEQEFIQLRTSRNQYKITPEERDLLAQKKIGVIGLSVGQSVSVTLAMERACGELRLADFDVLELTNLNRIRTGLHNLGLPKVYAVAREIAEIDPFLTVKCFSEGLSEKNMDTFFTEGGKLDLLVEESDGFDIKILSRYKAKELHIPVIMEASDRCTVDVERFDLEPDRDIMHGMVNHLDINILKSLKTTEDKIPYLLDMVGLETSSSKLKASMLEIDQTITTWPQLSSSVTMGGGIMADISRRIFLNSYTESGRYHVDIEELIGNKITEKQIIQPLSHLPTSLSLTKQQMESISDVWNGTTDKSSRGLTKPELQSIVEAAILAPSGGNMQPWKWLYAHKKLFLFHDIEQSASLLDYDNLASYISLGAAIENLVLKTHELNLEVKIHAFPMLDQPRFIAAFEFSDSIAPEFEKHAMDELVTQIEHRVTNRTISKRVSIDKDKLEKLQDIAKTVDGASLIVVDDLDLIHALGNIIGKVERIRIMNKQGHEDFVHEIRWTPEENQAKRNGVDLQTIDLTASEKAGFIVAKNWDVIKHLKDWQGGTAFEKLSKKAIEASSALGLIIMPTHTHDQFLQGGRAVQRVWLAANAMNISVQPQSPATFLFARATYGNGLGLEEQEHKELLELRKEFLRILNIDSSVGEIFLFRLCIASEPKIKSLRKNIDDVLLYNEKSSN